LELPLQITFHGIGRPDAIATRVRARAQKLETLFDSIKSCRVAIEARRPGHAKVHQFYVRVEVAVPGEQLVVTRGADEHQPHTDVNIALRDAFDGMRRRLENYSRLLHVEVRQHQLTGGREQ
jgi:ribosome-associated translation inhibitor RaiA